MDHMNMHIGQNHPGNTGTVVKHRQLIDRCFYSNSLEEIMDNLRRESDPFAKKCLQAMEKNSYLSMKLALKMLRNAKNLCYRGCLRQELDVVINKIQDADFDVGVHNVLQAKKNASGPEFSKDIKDRDLDRYF